jgi:hypothetical protein
MWGEGDLYLRSGKGQSLVPMPYNTRSAPESRQFFILDPQKSSRKHAQMQGMDVKTDFMQISPLKYRGQPGKRNNTPPAF